MSLGTNELGNSYIITEVDSLSKPHRDDLKEGNHVNHHGKMNE